RNNGISYVWKLRVDDVKIGPADPACAYLDANLSVAGGRVRALLHLQRPPRSRQHHRTHSSFSNADCIKVVMSKGVLKVTATAQSQTDRRQNGLLNANRTALPRPILISQPGTLPSQRREGNLSSKDSGRTTGTLSRLTRG